MLDDLIVAARKRAGATHAPITARGIRVLLDLAWGTYPYVTSSSCLPGFAAASCGISPKLLGPVIGVWLSQVAVDVPEAAYGLARRFWPGALTLVLRRNPRVPDAVTSGKETVAVRAPDHSVTQALIAELNAPLAATSANLSGQSQKWHDPGHRRRRYQGKGHDSG